MLLVPRVRASALGCALVGVGAFAFPAWAQAPIATKDQQAEEEHRAALYHQGVESAAAGRWGEARDRFADAQAIRASPKVAFSLGQAEEQLGHVASASVDYRRALDMAEASTEKEVVTAAQKALAEVEPRVPHVRVLMSHATEGTPSVLLDHRPVALGVAIAVDPGTHAVQVTAPGMEAATATVTVREHEQVDVPVRLEAVEAPPTVPQTTGPGASPGVGATPAPTAAEPQATTTGLGPWRAVGLAMAGAGVLGLGVGTYFGLDAKSKNDQSNSSGCNANDCTAPAAQLRRDALSAASASTIAFVIGGALAAGGVALWLLAPSARGDAGVRVTPVALGPGGGLVVTGGWR